jgi:hypothetical protein
LQAFNLALGELAHTHSNPKWSSARALLGQLLPEDIDPDVVPYRARGFAMDSVVLLAARTGVEGVQTLSQDLGCAMEEVFSRVELFGTDVEKRVDSWLTRTWNLKSVVLQGGDFKQPSNVETISELQKMQKAFQSRRQRSD